VGYLFTKQGIISFAPGLSEEQVMDAALEAGAEDVIVNDDGSIDVISTPESFSEVKDALIEAGLKPENDEVTYVASTRAELDESDADKLLRMIDMLEDLDDVQDVYTNAEISDEILDAVS
jgi:transcriptional/translational regulatory protein YebC/TACO1